MLGRSGQEKDGSPVLRLEGALRRDAEFSGDLGPAPPDELGEADIGSVTADAETLYEVTTHAPLRGNCTTRVPFRSGLSIVTRTSFLLRVEP
jgi:hypothetical protein